MIAMNRIMLAAARRPPPDQDWASM